MKHFYESLFRKALKNIIGGGKIIKQNIKQKSFEMQFLWLSTRRFISHAKAVIYLCNKKQNLEALMLLRPIIELVVNLRWVLEDNTGTNRKQFMKSTEYEFNNGIPEMGNYWSDKNLRQRMGDIKIGGVYYQSVVKKLHEELHGNPAVIARSQYRNLTSMNSEAVFSVACYFTGHLLKVAHMICPDKDFMNHNDVLSKIKVSKAL